MQHISFLEKESMRQVIVLLGNGPVDWKHIPVYYSLITASLICLERHLYCTYYLVPAKAVYRDHKEAIIFMYLLVCYKFRNNFAWVADLWINNERL